jgi:hypothetical protein
MNHIYILSLFKVKIKAPPARGANYEQVSENSAILIKSSNQVMGDHLS